MMTNATYQFKQIAPDYATFKTKLIEFMPVLGTIMNDIDETLLYPAIFAEWATQEILYDRVDTFYRHVALDYYNRRGECVKMVTLVDTINSTETQEIIESYREYHVASFNNASKLDKPVSEINPYVDAQQVNTHRINELDANLRILDNIKKQYLYTFVLDFANHFASISTNYEYFYFWR